MDKIDRKLLQLVQTDGRGTLAKYAEAVALSVSAVNWRLKQLEEAGVIKKWVALLDPKKVELGLLAYVFVLVDLPKNNNSFINDVCGMEEILECHHVTGEWSYLLKIRARDTDHLEHVITEKLKNLKGVTRSHSFIALSSIKDSTILPTDTFS